MFPKSLILVSLLIVLTSATASASASDSQQQQLSRVGFVIMSQSHERHARIADDSSRKLIEDLRESGIQDPVVFVTHRDFPIFGAWTYFPLLPRKLKLWIALIIVNDYNVYLQLEHIRQWAVIASSVVVAPWQSVGPLSKRSCNRLPEGSCSMLFNFVYLASV